MLKELIAGFFYNGIITSAELGWINYCLMAQASFSIPIQTMELNSDVQMDPMSQYIQGAVIYVGLIGYTCFVAYYIYKNWDKVRSPEFIKTSGFLMNGIDVHRSPYSKYYAVLFLARRIVFVSMPLALIKEPSIHILFMLYQQLFYQIIYGQLMNSPHAKVLNRYMSILNETIVMYMFYHLLFLTDLAYNAFKEPKKVAEAQ